MVRHPPIPDRHEQRGARGCAPVAESAAMAAVMAAVMAAAMAAMTRKTWIIA